ncbi:dGTPase [Candidatus Kinetoplastibacterium desouzaii TCC079E]|uniref:Deoxyguanosinetriphosphate triphosphohydrolase-like protein n=1 Tax=Candidatus Kinetoplastidibacterium desouzai TCC079E TaxID=1208919 RepID=M1L3E9_9PROT|nr:deoxyguanosinetriphosphate triphosphohydrolase [Candidatus Kinetoplastibacterium desouzaii]AGF47248.1 dGTPase [Candidatus Kinetoplastibacterium desouzaii TCC079E]
MRINIAPYACNPKETKGRLYNELFTDHDKLNNFQKDVNRIICSRSFRKLESKTQVFVNSKSRSCFRTRLTHSLEVAHIARSISRYLNLSEDLVEAISLAHDLGHSPFGHAGQDEMNIIINRLNPDFGGFEHNLYALRIVDLLEKRYSEFNGLNLCFETREGIIKHCSRKNARKIGDVGIRFLNSNNPSLEAQLVDCADEIAYSTHDIDDGLYSGLIKLSQVKQLYLFGKNFDAISKLYSGVDERVLILETIREIVRVLVNDIIFNSRRIIKQMNPKNVDDVRKMSRMISFSKDIRISLNEIKSFLYENLYQNKEVLFSALEGRSIIKNLFEWKLNNLNYSSQDGVDMIYNKIQLAVDYIANMTDREAIYEYNLLHKI